MSSIRKYVIPILVLCLFAACKNNQDKITHNPAVYKQYKKHAYEMSNKEWVGFLADMTCYEDDSLLWDDQMRCIIHYNGNKSIIYASYKNGRNHLLTSDNYQLIDDIDCCCLNFFKNKKDKKGTYYAFGPMEFIPNHFKYIPYYILPIKYARSLALFNAYSKFDSCTINDIPHISFYSVSTSHERINTFINLDNESIDNVSVVSSDGKNMIRYAIHNLELDDYMSYIDSAMNTDILRRNNYSHYDEMNLPPWMTGRFYSIDSLLDFPIVSLNNDTTTLRDENGFILLNFWSFGCQPCIKNLINYGKQIDSIGYRIIENNGIKIMAINYLSDDTDDISAIADKTNSSDIVYSAKGIRQHISIPFMGYYYLLSPSKEIIFETGDLGDYSELLKAKADYEASFKN